MSIREKIMLPMVALTVAVAMTILIFNIALFSEYVDSVMDDNINVAATIAEDKLEALKIEAGVSSKYIAADTAVIEAIVNGDRDALVERSVRMQSETGVEFCTILDTKGDVLVRAHEPENFGDSLANQTNVQSALSGKSLTATEKGSAVRLSVRSGTPIYNSQGELIGAVSVGYRLDNDIFVDNVKSLLGGEVTVFLGDERVSTTITGEDGKRAVGTKAPEDIGSQVLSGQTYVGETEIAGILSIAKYTPIYGVDGKPVGMLFVGRYLSEKTSTISNFIWTDVVILVILLTLSGLAMLIIVRRIIAPISLMVDAAHHLAEGDTDVHVDVNTKDEMRRLADAFNEMIENSQMQTHTIEAIAGGDLTVSVKARSEKDHINQALETMLERNNEVFSQIVVSSVQVATGARQMADGSQFLVQGATEQSTAVEQLSDTISRVEANTTENAAMANKAAALADEIKQNAEKGSEQMEHMLQAVNEINEASQSIGKIIKVIDDIAFQTNILALNAAVEAARAGQHGKGFAVVAEEVRNLAAKSGEAAKDTGAIIENSIAKAELGVRIAAETSESLSEIVSGINESGQIVGEIAESSAHQNETISQINKGINQVSQVVRQNSATAEESAASSAEMSDQAELLQKLVSQFKLKNPVKANALAPHLKSGSTGFAMNPDGQ